MDENKTQENKKNIKVLRTYTSDMADAIRENEVSVIKIALAEKEKRDRESEYKEAKGTNLSKVFLFLGGVALIIVAIFGVSYIIKMKKVIPIPPVATVETFIAYDSKSEIDVTKVTTVNNLLDTIKKGWQIEQKPIEAIFLTKKINNLSETFTSKDFLSLIQTTMPGALIRSLSPKYLIGKYSDSNNTSANKKYSIFFIFETTDYNQAYASMLEWEGTMLQDLYVMFETTKPEDSPFKKPWNDIIVNNKDTRVLPGVNSEGLLYYTFVNKNNFVITNDIEALKEVISRLIIKNAN